MIPKSINVKVIFLVAMTTFFIGCSDDDINETRPEPVISFEEENLQKTVPEGNNIAIDVSFEAQAGLKEYIVTKDGQEFYRRGLVSGRVATTYELRDQAQSDVYEEGDEITYGFTLIDRQNRSTEVSHSIRVIKSKPFIDLIEDGTAPTAIVGDSARVNLVLNANVGLKSLEVFRDGESIKQEEFDKEAPRMIYEFRDFVDKDQYTNNKKVAYEFVLNDVDGNTDRFVYEVSVIKNSFTISPVERYGETLHLISGEINIDTTLSSENKYLLDGIVKVIEGAVVTIEAGTHIYGQPDVANEDNASALSFTPETKIMAEGTSNNPIVFTSINTLSGSPSQGDWAGIYINGLATTNDIDTSLTPYTGNYGGSDDEDNSGVMRYVVINYAGKSINGRGGGLSLNGVGSATTLEYIQVLNADADGVRLRGGTANLRYLISQNNDGRGLRWQDGWRGFGQFWVIVNNGGTAVEGRNNDDNIDDPIAPRSNPILSNLVFIGNSSERGLRFRRQSIGQAYNGIATGFDEGVDSDNNLQDEIDEGLLVIKSFHAFDNGTNFAGTTDSFLNDPSFNCYETTVSLTSFVGSTEENAFDPTTLNPWFVTGAFIGAVEAGNDWTRDWAKQ